MEPPPEPSPLNTNPKEIIVSALDISTLHTPTDKTPAPSMSMLFPENTPYRVQDNPFRGPALTVRKKEHKEALQDALTGIRAPFLFSIEEPIEFNGDCVGVDMSTEVLTLQ